MILRDAVANLAGALAQPLLNLVLLPVWLHLLGREGLGLVGFFASVDLALTLFTRGLGTNAQREFAAAWGLGDGHRLHHRWRWFGRLYAVIACATGAALALASGLLAHDWLNLATTAPDTVRTCLILLAVRIALAFPAALPQGLLMATGHQVTNNLAIVTLAVVGNAGLVAAVWWQPSVLVFVAGNLAIAGAGLVVLLILARGPLATLPATSQTARRAEPGPWRDSLRLVWINGLAALLLQIDRLLLSGLVPAAALGTYHAGVAGARLLPLAAGPVANAVFPRLVRAHAAGDAALVTGLAEAVLRVVGGAVIVVASALAFHAEAVLAAWLRDPDLAREVAPLLATYAPGAAGVALANVAMQVQWATGRLAPSAAWQPLPVATLAIALPLVVPHGGLAAAATSMAVVGLASAVAMTGFTLATVLRSRAPAILARLATAAAATVTCHLLAAALLPGLVAALVATPVAALWVAITTLDCRILAALRGRSDGVWSSVD